MIKGRRIVLVDDSIVRGTTSVKIVQMMYEAGASESICASPARPSPTPTTASTRRSSRRLLAANHSLDEMRDFIGVASLAFLSVDGIYRAVGYAGAIR